MTTIVLHAGMPKTGSTSIQAWLRENAADLRERGFTVVTARPDGSGRVGFRPCEGDEVNSNWIVMRTFASKDDGGEAVTRGLIDPIAAAADDHGDIVVSAEALARSISVLHEPTLSGLRRLANDYRVRVAYYARPQHTFLEAAWRQQGYLLDRGPSAFVVSRAAWCAYASTLRGARARAPDVGLEMRPFRPDLLPDGDVVADFAARFLGVEGAKAEIWANPSLPLEVVNILAAAPAGTFRGAHTKERIACAKRLFCDLELAEDERIALSRRVLRKFAHERFAAENAELGWNDFVPPPEDPDEIPGIEALDELWRSPISPADLALVLSVLDVRRSGAAQSLKIEVPLRRQ